MNHAVDAQKPFTLVGGLANTGGALNIGVHLRLNRRFQDNLKDVAPAPHNKPVSTVYGIPASRGTGTSLCVGR